MRYLSLFSGIEAATVAWKPLGWEAVAFSEVAKFPSSVLSYHYPDVPNLGDITNITEEDIKSLGAIDVVIGGSPCQDLSVAGSREGLDGERSSLFFEQLRIFNYAKKHCGARWLIWENVLGAFSSNKGKDFARVVGEMAGTVVNVPKEGWRKEGVAIGTNGLLEWCVLDSQWMGLAQRRKRIFTILDSGNWQDRPPILLESESGSRDAKALQEEQRLQAAYYGDFRSTETGRIANIGIPYVGCVLMASSVRKDLLTENFIPEEQGFPLSQEFSPNMVRTLTIIECERMQGFPDNYTKVTYNGKDESKCPLGERRKSIGNSMAVPVIRWIGDKISIAHSMS